MDKAVKRTAIIASIICVMVLATVYLSMKIIRRESRSIVNEVVEKAKHSAALRIKAAQAAAEVKKQLDKTNMDERAILAAKGIVNDPASAAEKGRELAEAVREAKENGSGQDGAVTGVVHGVPATQPK